MTPAMESPCIPFREIPHTTALFTAFLDEFQRVSGYYAHPPTEAGIDAAARNVKHDPAVRQSVVEVLREQNRVFSTGSTDRADEATERNLTRLANGAVAIVTGQQVGLFTGPAYSFYKAISAVRCAEEATRRGIDAVPVFWLATEDHDLVEVNHSIWNTRAGIARYELPPKAEDAGRRVGEVKLGHGIREIVAEAAESLQGDFAGEIARALRECYTPEETYGSAFGKFLARTMAGQGMILIDPLDARFHELSASVYHRALDEADSLRDALIGRGKHLEDAGYHAQVKVTGESTLLFYNMNGRREPLRSHNHKYFAGRKAFTREELSAAIESAPLDFTPNALLRAVVQDSLLPTAAYIGGPAEVAYMAQSQVAYQAILGRMPAILPRASFTIIEEPVRRLLAKYGLTIQDILQGQKNVRAKMEQKVLPRALARRFEKDEKALRKMLLGYTGPLETLDATLLGARNSADKKMLHQFLKLKQKAARAEGLRNGVLNRHERILLDSLLPHHALQERSLSALPFLAAYGPGFLSDLAHAIPAPGSQEKSLCAQQHHIVSV